MAAESAKGELYIAGDFNGRTGKSDEVYSGVIGSHGEITRNNNGRRMLDFCMMHNLIVTNTFFEHKDIHKITRQMKSREERSIIDHIVVQSKNRGKIMETRVRRGPES